MNSTSLALAVCYMEHLSLTMLMDMSGCGFWHFHIHFRVDGTPIFQLSSFFPQIQCCNISQRAQLNLCNAVLCALLHHSGYLYHGSAAIDVMLVLSYLLPSVRYRWCFVQYFGWPCAHQNGPHLPLEMYRLSSRSSICSM